MYISLAIIYILIKIDKNVTDQSIHLKRISFDQRTFNYTFHSANLNHTPIFSLTKCLGDSDVGDIVMLVTL